MVLLNFCNKGGSSSFFKPYPPVKLIPPRHIKTRKNNKINLLFIALFHLTISPLNIMLLLPIFLILIIKSGFLGKLNHLIMKTKISIVVFVTLFLNSAFIASQNRTQMTAGEIIETIIRQTGSEPVANTVDVIKTGKAEISVTGIVTCMFAPMNVLRKAVELNCNLIITHEPVFYNHRDETSQFSNDPVFLEKKKFIDDHGLVIWRFHDYIHRMKPDGIDYGMARKLQLDKYLVSGTDERFIIPETTLEGLLKHIKKVFPGQSFQVIGNLKMKVTKVTFSAGAPGSAVHFAMLRDPETEVVIAGEVPQWETYEYVHDAVLQGRNKAIIFLGHIPSEEAGMEFAAEWIKTFIKGIPVYFVECTPSYYTY